jgi:hypothetical protein
MSLSNDSMGISTINDGRPLLSSTFLEFCVKVRNNDPSIMPTLGLPFTIRDLSEREHMELADALLENTSVTYLELKTQEYTRISAGAMAKYVRTSKSLQRILWNDELHAKLRHYEEILCCFLPAIQESTSLKELHLTFPVTSAVPPGARKHVDVYSQFTVFESRLPNWPTNRHCFGCSPVWIAEEHHPTRVHTGRFAGCNECRSHFDQSARPSSPSKAMFVWACGGSRWTRDCAAKRYLQNHGIGDP